MCPVFPWIKKKYHRIHQSRCAKFSKGYWNTVILWSLWLFLILNTDKTKTSFSIFTSGIYLYTSVKKSSRNLTISVYEVVGQFTFSYSYCKGSWQFTINAVSNKKSGYFRAPRNILVNFPHSHCTQLACFVKYVFKKQLTFSTI